MNRIFACVILLATVVLTRADYIDSYNILSDNHSDRLIDAPKIRNINGGTVIIPVFDESCPEALKAPFSYACKIVEEYLPPCLPLKVKVSCGRINSSSGGVVSKVRALSLEDFGDNMGYRNAQMSMIKGVIMAELSRDFSTTYLDSVPNVEFLTEKPDIDITYNDRKLEEFSFSLDPDPGQQYDFVSLAIRDLLIGLGLSSSFRYDPTTGGLLNPSQWMTPFESFISVALGNYDNPSLRFANATKGELLLKSNPKSLKLYAPSQWQNGVSLNYFIPQDDSNVSKILSYDFCKGMTTRSLTDDYSHFIFFDLLRWRPNFTVSTSSSSSSSDGSTSLLLPYNGSFSLFDDNTYGISTECCPETEEHRTKIHRFTNDMTLYNYILKFHPYYSDGKHDGEGLSICILKKDGTWDFVYHTYTTFLYNFNMNEMKLNYDEDQYARTIDGYLRVRITTKKYNGYGGKEYNSTFFVIDYLPQKVNLSYAVETPATTLSTQSTSSAKTVRIYFSNTEGLTRIVMEQLRQGSRVPSKVEIKDFKKGYYDTTISKNTTFTAVGYNANGTSRSIPLTVDLSTSESPVNIRLDNNNIYVDSTDEFIEEFNYTITPIDFTSSQSILCGRMSDNKIDISGLSNGMYVLNITDEHSGMSKSFKFKK